MTGSGLVVGFANSSFEVLAGIGVFAALGFIATAQGQEVSEVAKGGIGLAFLRSQPSSTKHHLAKCSACYSLVH